MRVCKRNIAECQRKMKEHHTQWRRVVYLCHITLIARIPPSSQRTANMHEKWESVGGGINVSYRVKSGKKATRKSTHYCI